MKMKTVDYSKRFLDVSAFGDRDVCVHSLCIWLC